MIPTEGWSFRIATLYLSEFVTFLSFSGKAKIYSQDKRPKIGEAPSVPILPPSLNLVGPSSDHNNNNSPHLDQLTELMQPVLKESMHPKEHNLADPADHWIYTVAEKMNMKGDMRGNIVRPSNRATRQQQQQQQQPQQRTTAKMLPSRNQVC